MNSSKASIDRREGRRPEHCVLLCCNVHPLFVDMHRENEKGKKYWVENLLSVAECKATKKSGASGGGEALKEAIDIGVKGRREEGMKRGEDRAESVEMVQHFFARPREFP